MPGSKTGFPNGLTLGPDQTNQALLSGGRAAQQTLRIAANVVAGTTVVIGGDTYRVATAATDSTKNIGSELAATSHVNSPQAKIAMLAHGLRGGDIIRIDNEIMIVLQALNANEILVQRACCNTSIATHTATTDIFVEAAAGGGGIPVGLNATLTPTAFTPALVWAINNKGKEDVVAYQIDVNTVVVATADRPGGTPIPSLSALALSETLAGGGNAWDAATLADGRTNEMVQVIKHVPTAAQVTAGKIVLIFPFTPVVEDVIVRTVSTQALVAWDGAATVSGNKLTVDNAGSVDWAATDAITLFIRPS